MKYFIQSILLTFIVATSFAQKSTPKDSTLKNTIRVDVSSLYFFGKNAIIFGFERQLKNNKSISLNIGTLAFPRIKALEGSSTDSSVFLLQNNGDKGFHVSADMRFYLVKENKFKTPHGLYVGPFVSFNHMNKTNTWSYKTSAFTGDITTDLDLTMLTIGGQLGYQFLFGKHWALDMAMCGPGLGFYNFNVGLNTTLQKEQQSFLFRTLSDFVGEYIPAYARLNNEGEISTTGSSKSRGLGFRYAIHVGFRF
jgi:hypothetical protein